MSLEYDAITAFHYATYRPPLHAHILAKCSLAHSFLVGLDIGCGTGHSSQALKHYCQYVYGLEPSSVMLAVALSYNGVEYRLMNNASLQLLDKSVGIITFAGSLNYVNSEDLLSEISRVSVVGATIVVYDFKILLDNIIEMLIGKNDSFDGTNYDHQINFDAIHQGLLIKTHQHEEALRTTMTIEQIAHVLLASKSVYTLMSTLFGSERLHHTISASMRRKLKKDQLPIDTHTFATVYKTVQINAK